jgi:hypothetical protein
VTHAVTTTTSPGKDRILSHVNRPNQFRPTLTRLDDRIVPAANVWLGEIDDFSDPAHWSDGVPTALSSAPPKTTTSNCSS